MYARASSKPLWKLLVDFTPAQIEQSATWHYISDALAKEEALTMLTALEPGKHECEEHVRMEGSRMSPLQGGSVRFSLLSLSFFSAKS
jgi:L-fuconate dehydratase